MPLYAAAALTIATTFGVPPLAVLGGNTRPQASGYVRVDKIYPLTARLSWTPGVIPAEYQSRVYGFGTDPLGLSLRLGPVKLIARGGIRFFTRPIPIPEGQRFNFTADVGFEYRSIGITLHHVSNGGLARRNPGINFLMLTLRLKDFP